MGVFATWKNFPVNISIHEAFAFRFKKKRNKQCEAQVGKQLLKWKNNKRIFHSFHAVFVTPCTTSIPSQFREIPLAAGYGAIERIKTSVPDGAKPSFSRNRANIRFSCSRPAME